MTIPTLYQSEDYLIVNKPYDMYINSEDESETNSVTYNIAKHDSHHSTSSYPLHFVHRLDYATSGVLCIAKNKRAAAAASKLFEKRETKKYYLAVVREHVEFEVCDIEYSIGTDALTASSSHKMVAVKSMPETATSAALHPRPAHTRILVLETGYYGKDPVSVVLMKPVTGRRHQLRVHCAAIGHTILGDYTYSNTEDSAPHRMFLHAMRLVLPLPQETLDIQTTEPFFSDEKFSSKYRPERIFYKFWSKSEFIKVCDVTDRPLMIGVKYKIFKPHQIHETIPIAEKKIKPLQNYETTPNADSNIKPHQNYETTPSADKKIKPHQNYKTTPIAGKKIKPHKNYETTPSADKKIKPHQNDKTTPIADKKK